jgi:hypothetical protein
MTRECFCRDCGAIFDAIDEHDQLCKRCLLKVCRALVAAYDEAVKEFVTSK